VPSSAASPHERAVIRAKVGPPPLNEASVGRPRVQHLLADLGAMLRSERVLQLPTAAVYLAEAEWRARRWS
jgi:hypothetical protein